MLPAWTRNQYISKRRNAHAIEFAIVIAISASTCLAQMEADNSEKHFFFHQILYHFVCLFVNSFFFLVHVDRPGARCASKRMRCVALVFIANSELEKKTLGARLYAIVETVLAVIFIHKCTTHKQTPTAQVTHTRTHNEKKNEKARTDS